MRRKAATSARTPMAPVQGLGVAVDTAGDLCAGPVVVARHRRPGDGERGVRP